MSVTTVTATGTAAVDSLEAAFDVMTPIDLSLVLTVTNEPWEDRFEAAVAQAAGNMHAAARKLFGDSCHAAGVAMGHAACLLIVVSSREDDSSKSVFEIFRSW